MPGEIKFIARFGFLLCGLREQEIIYIKEKEICNNGYGCDCNSLHKVKCKNGGLTIIIAIGWTRGNKKALATIIIPTKYWEKFLEHCKNLIILILLLNIYKIMKKEMWALHILQ